MSRKKVKSGTWATRELLCSQAFFSLSGSAVKILFQFLLARDMDKKHNCLNCRNMSMAYKKLEGIHGKTHDGKPVGMARGSVTHGITDLLAKGFIEIVHPGGAYQKDKTVYGLSDNWCRWSKGVVFIKREKGKRAGYFALEKKVNHRS